MEYRLYPAKVYVDSESECLLRQVDSETEPFAMHTHDYYEVFMVVSGEAVHIVNGEKQHLTAGTLEFIRKSDIHSYVRTEKPFEFVNLTFTKETAKSLFDYFGGAFPAERLLLSPMPPCTILEPLECEKLYKKLSALNIINYNDRLMLKFKARTLLCEIFSKYFSDLPQTYSDEPYWFENMCEKMREKENFICGTAKMFELSKRSREHVSRTMKNMLNTTPSEFVNSLRVNYAANLLTSSRMSIIDVCYECGFGNTSWFYEEFKKRFGVTPKQFRSAHTVDIL